MREIQTRLLSENPRFRTIWVQYANSRGVYHIVITLFPQGNEPYTMVFGQPNDLSYESINSILQNHLVESN